MNYTQKITAMTNFVMNGDVVNEDWFEYAKMAKIVSLLSNLYILTPNDKMEELDIYIQDNKEKIQEINIDNYIIELQNKISKLQEDNLSNLELERQKMKEEFLTQNNEKIKGMVKKYFFDVERVKYEVEISELKDKIKELSKS